MTKQIQTGIDFVDGLISNSTIKKIAAGLGISAVVYLLYKALIASETDPLPPPNGDDPDIVPYSHIVIDPWGDGINDDGGRVNRWACAPDPLLWWVIGARANMEVALALRKYLERAGARVTLTREGNTTLTMRDRVTMIGSAKPDIYVAISHGMYTGKKCPSGEQQMATIVYPSMPSEVSLKSQALAQIMGRTMGYRLDKPTGVRFGTRMVCDETRYDGDNKSAMTSYFNLLSSYGNNTPVGVVVEPGALCNCSWQHHYLTSLRYGLNADSSYINVVGSRIAAGICQYLSEAH